jgi:Glycosyl hydrolases family 18
MGAIDRHDALWMGHAWVDGRDGQAALAAMAGHLRGSGIDDVFVHIGPLASDGSLNPALYRDAPAFLAGFRQALPGIRVSAWIGGVVGDGNIHLNDPATRRRIVAGAAQALRTGFDGIHYDLEPVDNGDQGLPALLSETRTLRPGLLSVATPQIEPVGGMRGVGKLLDRGRPKYWSKRYLAEVARRADQVAIMSYDTALPLPGMYGGFVARQTTLALDAIPPTTQVLIGLPAFHDDNLGHHSAAETVEAAVHGVRVALTRHGPLNRAFGLAMYVDYAATARDWDSYQKGWPCLASQACQRGR